EEAMDRAYEELADYEAAWTCGSFSLYEQGSDAVWRKLRDFPFGGGGGAPAVPAQGGCTIEASTSAPSLRP
ncbi:2'-5' RNA ligase family protein, partial [Streptomyces sp. SID10362]|nr:2'-5' RNA ligase family protein [Streptomyces sp. SID10362]